MLYGGMLVGQEHALDYTFLSLNIDTDSVRHPILMTERLQTPLASRAGKASLSPHCSPSLG
jgi:hypothetical protein